MGFFDIGIQKIVELFSYIVHQTFSFNNPINLFVFIVLFILFSWSLIRVLIVALKTQKQIKRGTNYLQNVTKEKGCVLLTLQITSQLNNLLLIFTRN